MGTRMGVCKAGIAKYQSHYLLTMWCYCSSTVLFLVGRQRPDTEGHTLFYKKGPDFRKVQKSILESIFQSDLHSSNVDYALSDQLWIRYIKITSVRAYSPNK